MDNRALKLTELPVANSVSNSDLSYLVSNGTSYAVNVATLVQYILSLDTN
jgi:hypothetical protein